MGIVHSVQSLSSQYPLSPSIPSSSSSSAAAAAAAPTGCSITTDAVAASIAPDHGEPSPSIPSSSVAAVAVGASSAYAVAASIAPDHGLALVPHFGVLNPAAEAGGRNNFDSLETASASAEDLLESIEKGKGEEAEKENKGKNWREEKAEKKEIWKRKGENLKDKKKEEAVTGEKAEKEKERNQLESKVAFPLRPGQSDCTIYLRTGDCKFGLECRFNHPQKLKRFKVQLKERGVHQTRSVKELIVDQAKLKKHLETNHVGEMEKEAPQTSLSPEESKMTFEVEAKQKLVSGRGKCEGISNGGNILENDLVSVERKRVKSEKFQHHQKANGPPCPFYMQTGTCKFRSTCKFNHPPWRKNNKDMVNKPTEAFQVVEMEKEAAQTSLSPEESKMTFEVEAKQKLVSGRGKCEGISNGVNILENDLVSVERKSVKSEKFQHHQKANGPPCPFYMQTGTCKFRSTCKFNHPPWRKNNKDMVNKPTEAFQVDENKKKAASETNKYKEFEADQKMEKESTTIKDGDEEFKVDENKKEAASETNKYKEFKMQKESTTIKDGDEEFKVDGKKGSASEMNKHKEFKDKEFKAYQKKQKKSTPRRGGDEQFKEEGKKEAASDTNKHKEYKADGKKKEAASEMNKHKQFKKQKESTPRKDSDKEFKKDASFPGLKKPASVKLNFLDLPIRPGAKVCHYYMRTGNCTFGVNCKYHHPDPTATNGPDPCLEYKNGNPAPHSTSELMSPSATPWLVSESVSPYTSGMKVFNSSSEWKGYSEHSEEPGQPECKYCMESGVCKLQSSCKFCNSDIHLEENIVWRPLQLHNTSL